MASVTIQIPDALVPRLRAAARDAFPEHADMTDGQLFKHATGDYWRSVLVAYEGRVAEQAAIQGMSQAVMEARNAAAADGAAIG